VVPLSAGVRRYLVVATTCQCSGRRVGVRLSRSGCPPVRPLMWESLRDGMKGLLRGGRPGISPRGGRPVGLRAWSFTPLECSIHPVHRLLHPMRWMLGLVHRTPRAPCIGPVVPCIKCSRAGMTCSRAGMTCSKAGMKCSTAGMTCSTAGMTCSRAGMTCSRAGMQWNREFIIETCRAGFRTGKCGFAYRTHARSQRENSKYEISKSESNSKDEGRNSKPGRGKRLRPLGHSSFELRH
jgi:hypothetical protein